MIVEAKNAKAFAREESVSASVALHMLRFEMLATVNLDHQVCRVTHEIDDIGANRGLSTKARAAHTMGAQRSPYQSFSVG
jgi:hypothetical protein